MEKKKEKRDFPSLNKHIVQQRELASTVPSTWWEALVVNNSSTRIYGRRRGTTMRTVGGGEQKISPGYEHGLSYAERGYMNQELLWEGVIILYTHTCYNKLH